MKNLVGLQKWPDYKIILRICLINIMQLYSICGKNENMLNTLSKSQASIKIQYNNLFRVLRGTYK